MDSENFYQFGGAQPTHGRTFIHEWYPSLNLSNEDFNRYMNDILPNSKELMRDEANFVDMGYGNQLIYSSSCPAAASPSNNYNARPCSSIMGSLSYSSSPYSTHDNTGMHFMSYVSNGDISCTHSSKESVSFPNYDHSHQESCYSPSSTVSTQTLASRNGAINPGTKRVTTSSLKRPSHEAKKPRAVQSKSSCLLPKVGKEKIGDRIAALHKLVAPFGKTDTATVLTEAIGYINFLHHQIQTLSTPREKPCRSDARRCFDEVMLIRKRDHEEELEAKQSGLRSRGLCLVPFSLASYTGLGDMSW